MKRTGERYAWGDIDEATYRAEITTLKDQLAALPSPVDSNVVAFDRAAMTLLPLGTVVREAPPENQGAIIRHIVERELQGWL